ncbi:hypothetical protein A2U01_0004307, partial [Trifolium medium]|nr:hypothetical protein [Trifolium medium]
DRDLFPTNSSDHLTAYVDADWGSCQLKRSIERWQVLQQSCYG